MVMMFFFVSTSKTKQNVRLNLISTDLTYLNNLVDVSLLNLIGMFCFEIWQRERERESLCMREEVCR